MAVIHWRPVLNLNLNDDSSSSTFASIAAAFLPSFLLPGGQDASQDAGQDAAREAGANASVKEVCWDCFVVDHFLDTQGQLINKKDMSAEQKARKSDPNPSHAATAAGVLVHVTAPHALKRSMLKP